MAEGLLGAAWVYEARWKAEAERERWAEHDWLLDDFHTAGIYLPEEHESGKRKAEKMTAPIRPGATIADVYADAETGLWYWKDSDELVMQAVYHPVGAALEIRDAPHGGGSERA